MNKKGQRNIEAIFGLIIFGVIMFMFISGGIFLAVIQSFNQAFVGGLGLILGILFVFIIVLTLLGKILGK